MGILWLIFPGLFWLGVCVCVCVFATNSTTYTILSSDWPYNYFKKKQTKVTEKNSTF